jgi:uncharacterized radical SAM superfamily Fe-S cluster-containing enzyme
LTAEPSSRVRPWLFYDTVTSICSACLRRVEGRIVITDDAVLLEKRCPIHGFERVLLADDPAYWRMAREVYVKRPEMPRRFNTPTHWGCPYDCGLCPEHMQHSCLSLIEVTDRCNLSCPVCYAESGPTRTTQRSLAEIERMLDAVVANEGEPDVVQISGGEPTIHPDFWAILDAARARPIKHLMVNTNGIRIAREPGFAERLASYAPGFEVYLQWDSARSEVHRDLRGADLADVRRRALDALDAAGLSTTLVVTVKRGLNDHELGSIIDFALTRPCVRGVTFQPIQAAGRVDGYDPVRDRITLTEIRRKILAQTSVFSPGDMVPVPCAPDNLAMAYALKLGGTVTPLTGMFEPSVFLDGTRNTIVFERDPKLRETLFKLFATNHSPESSASCLSDLLCCLPKVDAPPEIRYDNLFRVLIMQFIDAYSFDLRAVKKSCVHMALPDGKLVPFDTYNLFYRDDKRAYLERLRAEEDARWAAAREPS